MRLKDNSIYSSTSENIDKLLSFRNIANKPLSELIDEYGNDLLIYPHSFNQCSDEIGNLPIFSLRTNWRDNRCTKATLETGNMTGFVSINGEYVSIYSRFSNNEDNDFFLYYMLSKVLCINVLNMPHGTSDESIFDFLLFLFPKLLNDALLQGIYKEYIRSEYNNANLKGTIDISRHLQLNSPFRGSVSYRTREFSQDNHITELIRHTIDHIQNSKLGKVVLENDLETRTNVAKIIASTPLYNKYDRNHIIRRNNKPFYHPYFSSYIPLQKLCLKILNHQKNKHGDNRDLIHGILFDVSYLWEEYLASLFIRQGFKHPNNKKDLGRIYLAKYNKLPRYPDFYREDDNIIIDAKYKKDINREDTHQMISYIYRLRGKQGIFILPDTSLRDEENSYLLGHGEQQNAILQKYFYQIPQTANSYKQFATDIEKSEIAIQNKLKRVLII